jgi:hypothetical protein
MNKTVVFITFACLAGIALVGAVVLLIVRPDASATFIQLIVTVLGLVSVAAGTFYGLGKQGEKLDEIKTQTNGTLSKRDDIIANLQLELAEARGVNTPVDGPGRHVATEERNL